MKNFFGPFFGKEITIKKKIQGRELLYEVLLRGDDKGCSVKWPLMLGVET